MSVLQVLGVALALGVGLSYVVLLAIHLTHRRGRHLPWWGIALAVVAVLVAAALLTRGTRTLPLAWTREEGREAILLLLIVGAVLLLGLLRLWSVDWIPAILVTEAIVLIGILSWLPTFGGWPWLDVPDWQEWQACFTSGKRWGTYGRTGVLLDMIPNVAMYVPLGAALVCALRRWRWLAIPIGLTVTFATESYQALFTDRECAGNDVLTNLTGTIVGAVLVIAIERGTRSRASAS